VPLYQFSFKWSAVSNPVLQFNVKEQTAIVIMAGSAAATPEAMITLAVQKIWYDINPSPIIGLSLIFSAQMLGYGVGKASLIYLSLGIC
jgi:hypothetical protein